MKPYARILLVEDDPDQAQIAAIALSDSNYEVTTVSSGSKGLQVAVESNPDLVILDINLPGLDGLSLCRKLRATNEFIPILFLSARKNSFDKIVGLEVGGDDYLAKPFDPLELVARVRALLRRSGRETRAEEQSEDLLSFKNLKIDFVAHEISIDDREVQLTPLEFSLLSFFVKNPRRVFEREQIIESVWGHDYLGDDRTVDTHIRNLRKKISSAELKISAVRGVGYKLEF